MSKNSAPPTSTDKLEKQKVDLIVIGNQNSGKTSLIKRFVDGESNLSRMQRFSAIITTRLLALIWRKETL